MTHSTSAEIEQSYIRDLGQEFGQLFYHAHAEWCRISVIWHQFENLFGRNKERVKLLNDTGGQFFAYVDELFFEATVLGICRLTDPKKSVGKENLTVLRFTDFMDTPVRTKKMESLIDIVKKNTEFHRDWRNRHIVHNDIALKLKAAKALIPATRNGMRDAIDSLYAVFQYINLEFRDSNFSKFVITSNDEIHMLYNLYAGQHAKIQERNSIGTSKFCPIKYPDWLHHEKDDPFSTEEIGV